MRSVVVLLVLLSLRIRLEKLLLVIGLANWVVLSLLVAMWDLNVKVVHDYLLIRLLTLS